MEQKFICTLVGYLGQVPPWYRQISDIGTSGKRNSEVDISSVSFSVVVDPQMFCE